MHGPIYRVLTVGVNRTHGSDALRFAEKDARDLAELFTSALGPAEAARCLLGRSGRGDRLDRALSDLARVRPDYLVFAFAGHGSDDGLALSDGLYPFARLRHRLQEIDARGTMVILDHCHAGAYLQRNASVGALSRDWVRLLATATPGTRVMAATSAQGVTDEYDDLENGVFTYALIQALTAPLPGDLRSGAHRFVSDRLAFIRTRRTMRRFDIEPKACGVNGDFPLLRSHESAVGSVRVRRVRTPRSGRFEVDLSVRGRNNLPTLVECVATDIAGRQLVAFDFDIWAERYTEQITVAAEVDHDDLLDSPYCRAQLFSKGVATYAWRISAWDEHDRPLARAKTRPHRLSLL